METVCIENKLKNLEDRIDIQEKIHDKITPDGNYYHNVFFNGGTLLIGIAVALSVTVCVLYFKNK